MGETSVVTLACSVCKDRNYSIRRNTKKEKNKLDISKFCRRCRKHTPHAKVK